jgi:hypothetical protein|tara:strand:- start:1404 stop:1610 length:207 start_codon:yes stop_codon:yes gene_type:complete
MSELDNDPREINCDEPYNNDLFDADEEYPRSDDTSLSDHPGPFASINQIVAYYESQGIFNEEDDALGS